MKRLYTEYDVMEALDAIAKGTKVRRASLDWGVLRTTLQNRIYGHESYQDAAILQQRLAPVQENHLTDWILVQESIGLSPTHTQIKDFAQRLIAVRGDTTILGKRWINAFLKRNPVLKTKKQLQVDSVRVNGATSNIISLWSTKLDVPTIRTITLANRWNIDEAGIIEGQGINGLVVGSKHRRFVQKKQPGSRAWTSFIKCISATGVALPPLVMFKGKTV